MATSPPGHGDRLLDAEPKGGGHGHDFVPAGPTHGLGYEPDRFAVKTILVVPVAVIGTAFGAFVVTWIVFASVFDPRKNNPPAEVAVAAERNAAPLNDRFARISSSDAKADVQQPRLEGLQKTQVYYRDGNPENKDPNNIISAEFITTQPAGQGNSPRFHADDLRPDRWAELNSYGLDKQTGVARVPVDKAMEMAVGAGLLPAQPGAKRLDIDPNPDRPKESNAGHGRSPEPSNPAPSAKKGPDEKKEPEKKAPEKKAPEKKAPEDKKEPEKKGPDAEKK
jgi:hypothetical protein